ncbi:recombination-related endonuclease [Cyanophage S-RIM44]|uniref:Recombination-related endonuclease n=2 Tax=Vellamovirus TaxID=2733139 RepID=A0A127KNA1_9CAUD|nr:SbcD-like subunit of palindrome specific endonuclease [Cyanophage S-RIM44]AMO43376.1 recombination-related endonuclease [Cyanophage S-RIM44]AOO11620.1 recombination-related endonuclease [Cyanophage S-RIM44]AOO11848.1 recombination-related endonuclease [Cyanophage S-RIM44]AOO12085.1 recombination-related endonuclease [Cyanophage S-RIM44]AOO12321.1 recombination-related endonuclease [Cyanophage S-RIM44]
MKIALITDQHLDGRKGNLAFWNYFQKFYDDVFFPTLEKEGIDTIIDLGDTFDNRKSIDFNVCNRVTSNYFDKLKDFKVHMLLGNHCVYYKNTNKINSPELLLKQYDNITIYSEPKHLKLGSKKFLMLPWINKENQEDILNLLETSEADNVCGHLELSGFEITPGMKMDHGMDASLFHRFKRVWSGHYHHKSTKGNITYLGNPYQMYWNDYKDRRGFHIYDTESDKLKFVANPYDIFDKIFYDDTSVDYNKQDVSCYKDKFIKVIVEQKTDYHMFETLVDRLYNVGVHDVKIAETLLEDDLTDADENLEIKDTMTLLNEYIDEVEMSVNKSDLKGLMKSLYIESCEVA